MRELRVAGLSESGDHLLLSAADGGGAGYRVVIDDRLRAALRGQLGRVGQQEIRLESSLSPREIQARLRAGEAAEDIARAAGVPVERIIRFEGPILAERALVAERARAATLSVTHGEWTGVPLGGIVTSYFDGHGIDPAGAAWDAWRREDGRWVVQVRFGSGKAAGSARWLWDPEFYRLSALDEGAQQIVAPPQPEPEPAPPVRLRAVEEPPTDEPDDGAPGEPPAPGRRTGRAAVPAWADVLLGPSPG